MTNAQSRTHDPSVSVIIPVRDGGPGFRRCLKALSACHPPPHEVIVVDDGLRDDSARAAREWGARVWSTPRPGSGPALARNIGVQHAVGDIVMFVDADVALHPDAIGRIQHRFAGDASLAACFGSYDDDPDAPNFLSQFKNLFHHFVHQTARAEASTFWAGCGAIRRDVFVSVGGFSCDYVRPAIEDIELGYRLIAAGHRLKLDKDLQARHLKRWTWRSLLRSDVLDRGVPWTRLILRDGAFVNDLNLQTRNRISVVLVYGLLLSLMAGLVWPMIWAVSATVAATLLILNWPLYRFFAARRGRMFALRAIPMHWLYYCYNGVSFAIGLAGHLREIGRRRALTRIRPQWLVFAASLAVALALVPWVAWAWEPQGDEPHYLLAAHSLVFDGDLDLDNNYRNSNQWAFYPHFLDRHIRVGLDGRSYLSHDIGLPALIAPAYALGGRTGVLVFLAVIAALVAVNIYLLAYEVTSRRRASLVTWFCLAFTPLLSAYAYLVYPEMPGSLIVVWVARQLLNRSETGLPAKPHELRIVLEVGLALSLLPWLSARFIPIAPFLAGWGVWRWRAQPRATTFLIGIPLLSLAAYAAATVWMNGAVSGATGVGASQLAQGFQDFTFERVLRGLAGWWLDQQRGLLVLSPVFLVALIGIPLLWRRLRWSGLALLTPMLIAYGLAAAWGGFWVGWEISARYLVVGLPLLAAPMALAWSQLSSVAFRGLAIGLLALSVLNTALVLRNPGVYAYRESVVLIYERWTQLDLWRGLPAMGSGARVEPDGTARTIGTTINENDQTAWTAPAGKPGMVFQSASLEGLTVGAYQLRFEAHAESLSPSDATILIVGVYSNDGIELLRRELTGLDFAPAGASTSFTLPFQNPLYNKWSKPVYVRMISTGQSEIALSDLTVIVDHARTWGLTGVWLAVIGLTIVVFDRRALASEGRS